MKRLLTSCLGRRRPVPWLPPRRPPVSLPSARKARSRKCVSSWSSSPRQSSRSATPALPDPFAVTCQGTVPLGHRPLVQRPILALRLSRAVATRYALHGQAEARLGAERRRTYRPHRIRLLHRRPRHRPNATRRRRQHRRRPAFPHPPQRPRCRDQHRSQRVVRSGRHRRTLAAEDRGRRDP